MGSIDSPRKSQYPFLLAVLDERHPLDREISYYVVVIAESHEFWLADNSCWVNDLCLPAGRVMDQGVEQAKSYHRFKTEPEALKFIKDWWAKHRIEE